MTATSEQTKPMPEAAGATQTTVPPRPKRRSPPPQPRRIGGFRRTDVYALFGALGAAVSTTLVLWTQLEVLSGLPGYVIVTWILFVLYYAILVSFDESRPTMRDRVAAVAVQSLGAVVVGALAFVIVYTFYKARQALPHVNFFTQDMRTTGPLDPLTQGGIAHAMVGTLIEVGIVLAFTVPLGLLGAVFLHQVPGRFSRFVRTVVEAMTALPDVLAGLFIYATLILTLGLPLSGFAAACALAVTALPIVIRAADVVLRLVPGSLVEASYALGSGQWRMVWHVLLPTARSGMVTAVILGSARAIGETAPVLLTSGATGFMNLNPFHEPMMSLPLQAYTSVLSPQPNEIARGFGAAAALLMLVLVLFAIARIIGGRGAGQLNSRQEHARARQSARDLKRFARRAAKEGVPL
jgi:phosphate transport system permease protein